MYTSAGTLDQTNEKVNEYLPLVRRLAYHLKNKLANSVELDDLIQAGLIGLLDAIAKFEDGKNAQFPTYATQRIKGAMLDELRSLDWAPRSLRANQRKIQKATSQAQHALGRSASEMEISTVMGISLEAYQKMLFESSGAQIVLYDDHGRGDDENSEIDNVGDEESDPIKILGRKKFHQLLVQAIEDLPEREKILMSLYYEQDLNFREISAILGVVESRVSQMHTQAILRLRVAFEGELTN